MFRFEKLRIWQESRIITNKIYFITNKFPNEEKYCLTDQIRRAAISVCLNIAEGSDRKSDLEFKRFLRMAISSAEEVVTGLFIALDLNYINKKDFNNIYQELNIIVAKIYSLIKSLGK